MREQLKYEKISSENEFTVKVELSLCTGGQCHDLETKMKMKVLKNIFWDGHLHNWGWLEDKDGLLR